MADYTSRSNTNYTILTLSFENPSLVRKGGANVGLESGLNPLLPLNHQLR